MDFVTAKWVRRDYLLVLVFLQLVTCVAVFLNVPIAREVLGFFFLTFVPGFLILKLLKLDEFHWVETILFSVGFSIAFLMIAGLLLNESFSLLGFSRPLSLMPLMMVLNALILMGGVSVCLTRKDAKIAGIQANEASVRVHSRKPLSMILFLCLPVLSIVGAMYVNAYGSNVLLLFTIAFISVLLIGGVMSQKILPPKLYPLAVFMIAIAILYHATLISSYIVPLASDVPGEYFIFKYTHNKGYWSSSNPYFGDILGRFDSMLSITILPTIYSDLSNLDQMIFKAIFPLIFALVPLGLYQLWKHYVEKKYALISAFLLMAESTFYSELVALNRQMIAELFFVLLFLAMLHKKIKPVNKTICFLIFSFALVTSHYSLAEIFLVFIALTFFALIVLKRPSKDITAFMVVVFSVLMFTWYIYTSRSATFNSFLRFGDYVYQQLGDFANPASRGTTVMQGLGATQTPSVWNTISRIFAYLTEALIVVGFAGFITKRSKIRIEKEYFILSFIAMVILAMLIVVPGLANTLNMTRFYHILLFFLAPFFVLGAHLLVRLLSKRERGVVVSALSLIVLVPYFLFQTNFVYEVTGSPSWSLPLSGYRLSPLHLYGTMAYIDAYSAYGAQWLSNNIDFKTSALYADESALFNVLTIYGMINGNPLYNTTVIPVHGVVYLDTLNVVYGEIPSDMHARASWNYSDFSSILDDLGVVYVNGGSKICVHPP